MLWLLVPVVRSKILFSCRKEIDLNVFLNKPTFRLTDDQGSADVGFVNPATKFRTENIDKLAANSVR